MVQIKGSTPFPFQTSFLTVSLPPCFLCHPTLILSVLLSFFLLCSYCSSCLSQETLISSLRGEWSSATNTAAPRRSFQNVTQYSIGAHIFGPGNAYMYALGCKTGTHQIWGDFVLKYKGEALGMLYHHHHHRQHHNMLSLRWGNKLLRSSVNLRCTEGSWR